MSDWHTRHTRHVESGLCLNTSWDLLALPYFAFIKILRYRNTTEDESKVKQSNPFYDDADLCLNYLKQERVAQ